MHLQRRDATKEAEEKFRVREEGVDGQLLFRDEVVQARKAHWMGSIRLGRPPSFAWVTGVALVLAAALIAFAVWGEVTRKAKLPGLLVPTAGLLQVVAPQSGVIAEVLVREGDLVQAGQPLMRLRNDRMTGSGEASALTAHALAQRRASLEGERLLIQQQVRQRQDALNDRLRSLQTEERQAQGELEASRLRAQLAAKSQERFAELARSGFVSVVQAQQKQEEHLDVQLRERNAERSLQSLQRDIQALRAELTASLTASQTSLAQLDRSLASLSQETTENELRSEVVIAAPSIARVSALSLVKGQAVQVGLVLVSLEAVLNQANQSVREVLEAHLFSPSRTVGFVKPGQSVRVRYAAFPFQKFGMAQGLVLSVSRSPLAPQDLPQTSSKVLMALSNANEPVYQVVVKLDSQTVSAYGHAMPLKAGLALEADVLQESRAVWEWLFEPILAVSLRYGGETAR